jgi:hypothetical protein
VAAIKSNRKANKSNLTPARANRSKQKQTEASRS